MSHYYENDQNLASKESIISFKINDKTFNLVTDNGVFSKSRLDEGSYVLLKTILPLNLGDYILDLGCGYGPIGLTIATFKEQARVDLADINRRALALCEKNAQMLGVNDRVQVIESNIYSNIKNMYHSIVVNPPIRAGKKVTYAMYEGAKQYLIDGGSLYIVIRKAQGALSAAKYIEELFGNITLLERSKGYHIYQAIKNEK